VTVPDISHSVGSGLVYEIWGYTMTTAIQEDAILPASENETREEAIIRRFCNGETINELARAFGCSKQYINAVKKRHGVTQKDRRVTVTRSRKHADQRPISSLHNRIGVRVQYARHNECQEMVEEMAPKVSLSKDRLVRIERGIHDATIDELTRIADYLDTSLTYLLGESQ
jgi:transcriptional regulator with XRE-family HTH domain